MAHGINSQPNIISILKFVQIQILWITKNTLAWYETVLWIKGCEECVIAPLLTPLYNDSAKYCHKYIRWKGLSKECIPCLSLVLHITDIGHNFPFGYYFDKYYIVLCSILQIFGIISYLDIILISYFVRYFNIILYEIFFCIPYYRYWP